MSFLFEFSCIHGDGTRRKRYLYVSDVVDAFDMILHKGIAGILSIYRSIYPFLYHCLTIDFLLLVCFIIGSTIQIIGEVYNIGTTFETSPKEVALKLLEKYQLTGRESEFIRSYPERPFSEKRYSIDATKLYELGWVCTLLSIYLSIYLSNYLSIYFER